MIIILSFSTFPPESSISCCCFMAGGRQLPDHLLQAVGGGAISDGPLAVSSQACRGRWDAGQTTSWSAGAGGQRRAGQTHLRAAVLLDGAKAQLCPACTEGETQVLHRGAGHLRVRSVDLSDLDLLLQLEPTGRCFLSVQVWDFWSQQFWAVLHKLCKWKTATAVQSGESRKVLRCMLDHVQTIFSIEITFMLWCAVRFMGGEALTIRVNLQLWIKPKENLNYDFTTIVYVFFLSYFNFAYKKSDS